MQFIRGLHNLKTEQQGCVAAIGNFDGVHLGHQRILGQLQQLSQDLNVPSCVVIFEPQPREYFGRGEPQARLSRLREKLLLLKTAGVDRVLCLRFNVQLVAMSAEAFIQDILVDRLAVSALVQGQDFRFGHKRQGDMTMLQQAGQAFGFQVQLAETVSHAGQRVSSTRVREALLAGDLPLAQQLLGRNYSMCGRVAHGDKRGRTIGFPTANVFLHRQAAAISGVFAVRMHGIENEALPGVANIGNRPTVDGTRTLLEVHLFNFSRDIYGHAVEVEFLHKLRDEKRFAGFEELKAQILRDAEQARQLLL